ncbi:hypothetical protein NW755_006088 [Fusarium falciforme]|uniref:Uncharacterized protein n=1 Tax=Fusarium falciforme TaxID=195108 RepID=A0A9W8R8T2_9HYPO|nr:hypothetical protein NW755_006088 [Fusarium falciforme]
MADIVVYVVRLVSGQAKVILEKRQPSDNDQTTDIKVQLDERQETAFAAPMRSVGQYGGPHEGPPAVQNSHL